MLYLEQVHAWTGVNRRGTGACEEKIAVIGTKAHLPRASVYVDRTKDGAYGKKTVVTGTEDALLRLVYLARGFGPKNRDWHMLNMIVVYGTENAIPEPMHVDGGMVIKTEGNASEARTCQSWEKRTK